MKTLRIGVATRLVCAVVAAALVFPSLAKAGPLQVFLLAGQSNMDGRAATEGLPAALQSEQTDVLFYVDGALGSLAPGSGRDFGPEVTFGRTIADALPDQSFALIKESLGGTDLYKEWAPPSAGQSEGFQYTAFRSTVSAGLAALDSVDDSIEVVGMLWTQGESDAEEGQTTAEYQANLTAFIADMRANYGADLPFFFSQLSAGQTAIPPAGLSAIRTAQENVAASDPNAYLIATDGFGVQNDALHFDADGQIALGEAFAEAYLATIPEPASLALAALVAIVFPRRNRS